MLSRVSRATRYDQVDLRPEIGAAYVGSSQFDCVCKVVFKTVVGKVSGEQLQDAVFAEARSTFVMGE